MKIFSTIKMCTLLSASGLFMSSAVMAETAEQKGLRIAQLTDQADTGFKDLSTSVKMTLKDRHGNTSVRLMRNKTLEGTSDGDKTLIIFDNPRDVKGSAVLTWTHKVDSDDQWLFLPAVKRVKRISSRNKSGPFMGSEFAYEDLASQELEKYNYRYLREEDLNGAKCHVIERSPVDPTSGYSILITWIHQERLTVEKVVYHDRKKSLLKTLTMTGYAQYLEKFWRAKEFLMVNHQKGKETLLEWSGYKFENGYQDQDFHQNALKRAR